MTHAGSKRAMQAHWSRVKRTGSRAPAPMSREAELEAIARFEAERGVTACASAEQLAQGSAPGKGDPMPGWR